MYFSRNIGDDSCINGVDQKKLSAFYILRLKGITQKYSIHPIEF